MNKQPIGKGQTAEEALRDYFLSLGYFTVRSIPFNYKSFSVTDVDLWLYIKSSPLLRERTCVDIKRKKTPQAMERVFWSKGLREVLGIDKAIVATTDNRPETRDFGASNSVIVLHGEFLQRIISRFPVSSTRITEEQLLFELNTPCITDSNVVWSRFYNDAKMMLLSELNFNGCNDFLGRIGFLLEEYRSTNKPSNALTRLIYIIISYFLITLDYASRLISHLDNELRKRTLSDGFKYGEAGRERTDEIINMALQILVDTSNSKLFSRSNLKDEVDKQLSEYPVEILVEHFAKPDILKQLFALACEFERTAYAAQLAMPNQCSSEQKAILGLFCDFLKIDRKKII